MPVVLSNYLMYLKTGASFSQKVDISPKNTLMAMEECCHGPLEHKGGNR